MAQDPRIVQAAQLVNAQVVRIQQLDNRVKRTTQLRKRAYVDLMDSNTKATDACLDVLYETIDGQHGIATQQVLKNLVSRAMGYSSSTGRVVRRLKKSMLDPAAAAGPAPAAAGPPAVHAVAGPPAVHAGAGLHMVHAVVGPPVAHADSDSDSDGSGTEHYTSDSD